MRGYWIVLAAAAALSGGCDTFGKGPYAQANVQGGEGSRVWGRVTFHQPEERSSFSGASAGKTVVRVDINGLPPNRKFGFHVHEKGDCTGDFTGAGGHFNPGGKPHGAQGSGERHAGDLPNLESNGEGVANAVFTTDLLTVAPGPNSVVNRAIVIHQNPDDYRTQPAGNSGPRIACGVIRGE
ncbi:MAG TPA: superoxide dismutase family protein [Burkholderiaceae bacterium]|nr:superoxide dismutase family protein [Burkholderiaceae bacterium]